MARQEIVPRLRRRDHHGIGLAQARALQREMPAVVQGRGRRVGEPAVQGSRKSATQGTPVARFTFLPEQMRAVGRGGREEECARASRDLLLRDRAARRDQPT